MAKLGRLKRSGIYDLQLIGVLLYPLWSSLPDCSLYCWFSLRWSVLRAQRQSHFRHYL